MKREDAELAKTLALMSQLGFTVVACILGGFASGLVLDRAVGTYPLFLIMFLLIGIGVAFWRAYALIMRVVSKR